MYMSNLVADIYTVVIAHTMRLLDKHPLLSRVLCLMVLSSSATATPVTFYGDSRYIGYLANTKLSQQVRGENMRTLPRCIQSRTSI